MKIQDVIKIEPIDVTQILITVAVLLIVIYAFKAELDGFVHSLQERPITVKMSSSGTEIRLDAPVTAEPLADAVDNPEGSQAQLRRWEDTVRHIQSFEGFAKLGFGDLFEKLAALPAGRLAVINYQVNDPSKHYFNDESMLKYLSVASEKVAYLACYEGSKFVGAIKIQTVIAGLASKRPEFRNFGEKIKSGEWMRFPGLLREQQAFTHNPTIEELKQHLAVNKVEEVPLVRDNRLVGFLNYKTISDELYDQAVGG